MMQMIVDFDFVFQPNILLSNIISYPLSTLSPHDINWAKKESIHSVHILIINVQLIKL